MWKEKSKLKPSKPFLLYNRELKIEKERERKATKPNEIDRMDRSVPQVHTHTHTQCQAVGYSPTSVFVVVGLVRSLVRWMVGWPLLSIGWRDAMGVIVGSKWWVHISNSAIHFWCKYKWKKTSKDKTEEWNESEPINGVIDVPHLLYLSVRSILFFFCLVALFCTI